jgi:outer membrane protein
MRQIRSAFIGTIFMSLFAVELQAQVPETWDLRRCVEYAMKNNISVRQSEVDILASEITLKQSEMQRIPTLNGNLNHGFSFGRTLDRTTNIFVSRSAMFEQISLQSNALLFNFGSLRKQIEANRITVEAGKASVDKIRNDIGLNVANQYLRTLLSKEQLELSRIVLRQTQSQLSNTRKLVDAGTLPELNAAELEATEARDSATVVQTNAQLQLELLTLKSLLNLPADIPFDIDTPPVERIPVDNILEQDPEGIFGTAMTNQPQIRANNLREEAARKLLEVRRSQLYPSINAFAQLNTNFNQFFQKNTGFNITGESATGTYVRNGSAILPVYSPTGTLMTSKKGFGELWNGYGQQLRDQFGQGLGINISIPILNGWQSRANIERAKLDIRRQQLAIEQDTLRLKQDIYTAYQSAIGAYQTFQAREKAVRTAERSFELASKRYEIGVMQTIEWLTIQNNLTRAKIDRLVAQYDYVFRMKVLEFYKGKGLRL